MPHPSVPASTVAPTPRASVEPVAGNRASSPSARPPVIVSEVVNDGRVVALIDQLSRRGLVPEPIDTSKVPWLEPAPGQAYRLGEWWLHIHVFPDSTSAEAVAAEIARSLKHSIVDWVGRPNFFRCDHVIVLYLGVEAEVVAALTDLCGPQFAGGPDVVALPEPTQQPLTTIELAISSLARSSFGHAVSSPQLLLESRLASGTAVLYTYTAQVEEQPVDVTHISYLDWRDPVWYPDGSLYNARPLAAPTEPVQFLTGTYVVNGGPDTAELPDTCTLAGGRVTDLAVDRVAVTFSDNYRVVVPVQQGAYLAARLDGGQVVSVEALDAFGTVLYRSPRS